MGRLEFLILLAIGAIWVGIVYVALHVVIKSW